MVVKKVLVLICLFGLSCQNIKQAQDTDFDSLQRILNSNPISIKTSEFKTISGGVGEKNVPEVSTFITSNYLDGSSPNKMFYALITKPTEIKFVLSGSEDGKIPLKVSFSKNQSFYFGKKFKLLTEKSENAQFDYLAGNDFMNPKPRFIAQYFIKYRKAKYYDFVDNKGIWYIHHIFDVSDLKDVKYYIACSIYTLHDSFIDNDADGVLDFRQKYDYLPNSEDRSSDKYRTYSLK